MTGEMHPSEVTREAYPLHFAVADALDGTVHPFDHYQGPYVSIGPNNWIVPTGAFYPKGLGIVRLWFQGGKYGVMIYNEVNQRGSKWFPKDCSECAVEAARSVLDKE